MVCLLEDKPEVQAQLIEYTEILGNADAAYYVLSENNGYDLDRAPNGLPSKLFSDLLSLYLGDRNAVIQAKAKVYSKAFKNWFGDWLSADKTNVSKVVDENGEPLIVYHGGARDINTFRISSEEGTTARGHYTDPVTGEKIPVDSTRSIFFSDNKYVGVSYATLYAIELFQSLYNRVLSLIGTVYDGKVGIDTGIFKTLDYFLDTLLLLSEFNPRFEKLKNYIIDIRKRELRLNPKEADAFRLLLLDVRDKIRPLTSLYLMNRPDWEEVLSRARKVLKQYNTLEGVKALISGEIPETIRKEWELYKKIEQLREQQGLDPVANYEELDLHLTRSSRYYLVYDGKKLRLYTPDYKDPNVNEVSEDYLKNFLDKAYQANINDARELSSELEYGTLKSKAQLYPVFLNMRKPLVHDYEGTHQGLGYKQSAKYSFGYVAARLVNKAIKDGNDGVVYLNIYDPILANNYAVFTPNQVKSILNQGTFSTLDSNIYQNQVEETPESKKAINFYNIFDPEQYTGMTSREFITNVRSYFPSDNTTVNRLLDLFSRVDVPVKVVDSESLPQGKTYMYYNPTTGEITVAIDEFNKCSIGYNATSMLHELVHVFTYSSIEAAKKGIGTNLDKAAYDKLTNLYKLYKDLFYSVILDGEISGLFYGLKDEYEFVSELLTNSDFYNLLLDFANLRDTGIFNEIRNAILDFFNSIIDLILGREHVNQGTKEIISLKNDLLNLLEYNIQNSNTTSEDQFQRSTRTNANLLFNQTQTALRYHFDTETELNKRLRDVRNNLAKGLASRLKAVELDESTTYELKEQIKYQLRNLNDSTLDDLQVIMSFTRELALDVPVIGRKVLEAYKGNTPALSDDTLVSLSKNYFGFYCNYANTLYNNLSGLDGYRQMMGAENYDMLMRLLALCKNILDTSYDQVKRMQAENAKRLLTNIGISAKSNTILKYMEENSNSIDSDISILSRMFLSLDKMNDEVLRGLYKLVLDTENIIDNNTSVVARRLLDLAKRAGNKLKALYELDDDGKPTGQIIRDRKYGKMRRDYREALKKIRQDLGISEHELGLPENKEILVLYNKRKNEWLSKHVERKYTTEYYSYFLELSQEASMARELVMDKIRSLKDKYRGEDGVVRYEKFTDEDFHRLQGYYFEKRAMASIYNVDGSIKEEGTVERKIADELSALNEKLSKGLKMKTNREKFEQIRKLKEIEYGADSKEYKKWFRRNTRVVISEEFYKLLDSINRETYPGTDYEKLNQEKRALLNMFRDLFTGEVNVKLMPTVTKNRLNRIDTLLRNIRKANKAKVSNTGLQFKDIAKIVATDNYNKDRAEAMAEDATNPGTLQVFDVMNSVFDQYGMTHPRSFYSKVMPIDSKYISIEPSIEFAEMSEESPFINKKYDLTNPEYYQPKKELYDNTEAYNKVMLNKELRELRLAIIDVMKLSNKKLNNIQGLNEYKLPQISGSMYRFLKARGFSGIGYKLADLMSVRSDDLGIHDKVITAPDGSSLAMVPLYFIKDLEDPSTISMDLVGSVIQYYRMAENFKQKSAIKGKVENIKAFLRQREFTGTRGKIDSILRNIKNPKSGSETNIYKMAEKFINMNVYDVRTDNFTITVFGREVNFTKLLQTLKNYGTLVNLGLNFSCSFTGFFTALHLYLCNAICGRYYTFSDALNATKDIVWDLLRHGISAGSGNYKSEMMAYMDYFQVGSTMDSMWRNSNRPKWLNIITRHWAFGTYSMSDYLIKGTVLRSVMYNYRNVDGLFMYREEFLLKYGNTKLNRDKWKTYKSFAGSIKMIAGKPVAIDSKDQKAVDAIKYTVGNTAKNLAAAADGLLTSLQKAQFTTNVFGAMCMMHRLYIPILILENFTMKRHWDYTSQREVEALFLTPLRLFSMFYKDKITVKGLIDYIKNDTVALGNLKKLAFEIAMVGIIYPLITRTLIAEADRDKKDKLLNLFAYVMLRTAFESRSKYTINDIYNTIKSPTPLSTLLDNFGNIVNETISPITNTLSLTEARERLKRITRGAYKNMTPIERSIIKATPFKNIIELNDLPSKRNYYETQILN